MVVTRNQPLTLARRSLVLAALVALGCTTPTAADGPVELLTSQQYTFACGAWTPSPPPAARTLLDIRFWQDGTAPAPARELVAAVEAAGGRIVYSFHGPMVRVELNVAAVPRLAGLNYAVTVSEPEAHDVQLIVMLARDLTDADLQAVEALGGRVTRRFDAIEGYTAVIADSQVPGVRALNGVLHAGFDGMGCIQ